ncbi:MAG: alpha/beta hydrolase [Polyangiaceae bacterium]
MQKALALTLGFMLCATGCARPASGGSDERAVVEMTSAAHPAASSASAASPPRSAGVSTPAASSAPPVTPVGPATVESIPVAGDVAASIVRAADGSRPRVVFLPGVCSNANAYLQMFPEAARAAGGAIAIEGEIPCPGAPGFHSITSDPVLQGKRIDAALAAAGYPVEGELTVVGYSRGATLAEKLVAKWPDRFVRVVLIGSPKAPNADLIKTARAAVTMSCQLDVPALMKAGAKRINDRGVPAIYLEMPRCTHGNITEGDRVFGEAFAFLDRPAP